VRASAESVGTERPRLPAGGKWRKLVWMERTGNASMKRLWMIVACALATVPSVGPAQGRTQGGAEVTGRWLTDDRSGVIDIAPCGSALCGRLVSVLDPKAPGRDINNPDPALRHRALVGISILSGLTRKGQEWSGGQAYDPKAGRSYRAAIRLAPDGRLDVTGCLLVICRTKHWTRAGAETRS